LTPIRTETPEKALAYLRRLVHGQRVRSEEDIEALVNAVVLGFTVASSARRALEIRHVLEALGRPSTEILKPTPSPDDSPALRALERMGDASWKFAHAFQEALGLVPLLAPAAGQFQAFLDSSPFWLKWRATLTSESQMICVSVIETASARGLAKIQPMEMEALTIVAGVRDVLTELGTGRRSPAAWKTALRKVQADLLSALAQV
jgi:hypothetical protein